jgi:hypothetical protein
MANMIDTPRSAYLWTEQERDLYNRLPIYMAKMDVELNKRYQRWPKLLKSVNWEPNMGFTMQGVHKDRTPVLTSQVLPQVITTAPRKNVVEVRELQERAQLYRHNFESNLFHFLPRFADFLTDGIDKTQENINEQIAIYVDQFYRTAILHGSPQVWVCGKAAGTELTEGPYWISPTIALSKTAAFWSAQAALCTAPLTLRTVAKLATVAYTDLNIEPFSGDVRPDGTSGDALKHKYCLITGMETWESFQFDEFTLANRPLAMNIVTEAFTGDLFGRFTAMIERHPLHMQMDGTFPAPETTEGTVTAYDYGRSVPLTTYTSGTNSPFAISFLVGAEPYKAIRPGPPPREFQGMSMKEFAGLDWNGKSRITTNVLLNGVDQAGNTVLDTNKYGDYLQMIADIVMGIVPLARHRVIPILHQRARVHA